jgi:zinc protease
MRSSTARALVLALACCGSPATALEVWQVDAGTSGLLVEDHRAPLLFVTIEFPAGSWSPWVEEHDADAAFETQMRDSTGELRRRADRLAATVSLSAGDRASWLTLSCHREDAEAALDLVRSILANRDLDPAELKRSRQNRKLAWAASLKQPQFVLGQAAVRLLFREDDPRRREYEQPELPSTDVARLVAARDVLIRLPGRVVGLAGDLTLDEARRFARGLLPEHSPEVPPGIAPELGPLASAEDRPPEATVRLERLTQVYFAYGRDSLGWRDADYPASLIADHALGGHFNSRLMVALRQEGGDTYGAGVRNLGDVDPGAYGLASFTRTDNAEAAERKLREVLERFHAGGISEDERALAAGNVVGRRAFARQSPSSLLSTAMRERRHGLPFGFFDRQAERAAALSLEEVNAFIRRFHDPALFTMVRLRAK